MIFENQTSDCDGYRHLTELFCLGKSNGHVHKNLKPIINHSDLKQISSGHWVDLFVSSHGMQTLTGKVIKYMYGKICICPFF